MINSQNNEIVVDSLTIPTTSDELFSRRRTANFSDAEISTLVEIYQQYLDIFQSRDKRSEAMKKRKETYDEIAKRLNTYFPNIQRSGKQIAEKLKHLFYEHRRYPHVFSPDPTSDPTLRPLKPWQQMVVNIIRENWKHDLQLNGCNNSSYLEPDENETIPSNVNELDESLTRASNFSLSSEYNINSSSTEIMDIPDEDMSSRVNHLYYESQDQPIILSATTTKPIASLSQPNDTESITYHSRQNDITATTSSTRLESERITSRTKFEDTLPTSNSRIEDARIELIIIEKEKIEMEKELLSWKIKNAKIKNALLMVKLKEQNS